MKIPVFVSCPAILSKQQEASRRIILHELDRANLEPRALGRTDYPSELPLREVWLLAKHCSGGIILGFEQILLKSGTAKRGTSASMSIRSKPLPTPWNNLEAGILFSLALPMLVFKEDGIGGGIFDPGVTDVSVHRMPEAPMSAEAKRALSKAFQRWQARVTSHHSTPNQNRNEPSLDLMEHKTPIEQTKPQIDSKVQTTSGFTHRRRAARKTSSDIFISYASADREAARFLAEALTKHGWSIWWDRAIPPGKSFDEVIESALDSARCVIVLWSTASVSSRWVKSEADEGARRQVLVPVLIQEVRIPLAFRHIEAAKLVDWNGSPEHPEFEDLVSSVTGILNQKGGAGKRA